MGFTLFGRNLDHHYGPAASFKEPQAIAGVPWQQPLNPLPQIVIDDIWGEGTPEVVTRAVAMKVPGVARGRNLLVGTIADIPLVAIEADSVTLDNPTGTPVAAQPKWLGWSGTVSIWHRLAWTIDDLIFHGASVWWRINAPSPREDGGVDIIDAYRLPREFWQVNEQGQIEVRPNLSAPWAVVGPLDVIYIPGPGDALLSNGHDTISGARNIDKAWVARTRSPIPPTLFEQIENEVADPSEVTKLLNAWARARTNPNSAGTGFVPYGLRAVFAPLNDDSAMFIQGRNAVRLDVANFLNLPASMLDGSTATASLTYVTAEGERSTYNEQTMRYWTAPLEHRLSMDDIVPDGQRIRFDLRYTTQTPPYGEPGED